MKKNTIIPGETYTIDEFNNMLKTTKRENCREKFIKNNTNGYWSYIENRHISKDEVEKILEICGYERKNVYNFFNINNLPFKIKIEETGEDREDVKSINIYDKMMAKTITHYKGSFQIEYEYHESPITITTTFSKNTTLNVRDLGYFM